LFIFVAFVFQPINLIIMRQFVLLSLFVFESISFCFSQDCGYLFTQKAGSILHYANYKAQSKQADTYIDLKILAIQATQVTIESQSFDATRKHQTTVNATMICNAGNFEFDITAMMGASVKMFPDIKITGNKLMFPAQLRVGQTLRDAIMHITSSNTMMIMDMKIYDRKVVALETITTSAGTFECYKITSTAETKIMGMTVITKTIEWTSVTIGKIKSENYDKAERLISYDQLESIQ